MALGCYERIVSMDGKLTGRDRSDRRLLLAMSTVLGTVPWCFILPAAAYPPLLVAFSIVTCLPNAAMLFMLLTYRPLGPYVTKSYLLLMALSLVSIDLHQQTLLFPATWPYVVILADASLLLRLGSRFASMLMGVMSVWIVIVAAESVFRFGLYDLPGTSPQWHRQVRLREMCDCDNPPCSTRAYVGGLDIASSLFVLLIDFVATRGFAESAEREKAAMGRTIETVGAIAQLLAGYDVDTVAEMLQEAEAEGRLPAAMHAALQDLEQNLRAYRPYLPEALFAQHSREGDEGPHHRACSPRHVAPGVATGEATVVFTDVRSSTSIWEAAPEAMKKGMQTHNAVMREGIRALGGYEVKTIGDAFMVAFEEVRAGVDFGLTVQQGLFDAEWPAALLEVGICNRTDLWGGLTVRVGVNHGPVTLETNTLTGRVDYFGHTVNVAARLEGACAPGAVAVPADLWAQVGGTCLPAVAGAEVPTNLSGVTLCVGIRDVWPLGLAGRQHRHLKAPGAAAARHNSTDMPLMPFSTASRGSFTSTLSTSTSSSSTCFGMKLTDATIGTMTLCAVDDNAPRHIAPALEAVMPLLQKSRGTLVTLLGQHVFVAWNLVQAVPVHAESAVQFAQHATRAAWAGGVTLGLASGTVHHGDVGTSTQRFVTAAGHTVCASLRVWCLALEALIPCLYRVQGQAPPGALHAMLHASPLPSHTDLGTLYELQPHTPVALPSV